VTSEEDLVNRSIGAIINTDPSERPFLLKNGVPYGTRMRRALFEPAGFVVDIFRYEVPRALEVWEPRIVVLEADAVQPVDDPHKIIASVQFRYRSTNRTDNWVRPYRLQKPEGQA
jgi:phage baseplate assembly protein W